MPVAGKRNWGQACVLTYWGLCGAAKFEWKVFFKPFLAQSILPKAWLSLTVGECYDPDMILQICVDNQIREALNQTSMSTIFAERAAFWKMANRANGLLDFRLEIKA